MNFSVSVMVFWRLVAAIAILVGYVAQCGAETFMGGRTDFRDETIYFAMTTRFYDGDPKNNVCGWDHQSVQIANNDPDWRGDFKGLIDKLDYIKALGFTAVWITPVVENGSGLDYHGYHAMDFSKIDHRYVGKSDTDADADVAFQTLIDEVHKRGMKIILDIVLQHTGNFGEAHLCKMFEKDYSTDLGDISCMKVVPQSEGHAKKTFDNTQLLREWIGLCNRMPQQMTAPTQRQIGRAHV